MWLTPKIRILCWAKVPVAFFFVGGQRKNQPIIQIVCTPYMPRDLLVGSRVRGNRAAALNLVFKRCRSERRKLLARHLDSYGIA